MKINEKYIMDIQIRCIIANSVEHSMVGRADTEYET